MSELSSFKEKNAHDSDNHANGNEEWQSYQRHLEEIVQANACYEKLVDADEYFLWKAKFPTFLLTKTGCCIYCFESEPMVLQEHHFVGRNNSALTVTVCANCHIRLTRKQGEWAPDWSARNNSIETRLHFFAQGVCDMMHFGSERARHYGKQKEDHIPIIIVMAFSFFLGFLTGKRIHENSSEFPSRAN